MSLYQGIPSVELGHQRGRGSSSSGLRSPLGSNIVGRVSETAQRMARDPTPCADMASVGKHIAKHTEGCLPKKPPALSSVQHTQLAKATIDRMRMMKPHYRAADACVYAFTIAFLHVFLVCVIAPSFFYWYYRWKYRRQYKDSADEHLAAVRRQVLARAGVSPGSEVDSLLGAGAVPGLLAGHMEARYMGSLDSTSSLRTLNNSVVKYRSLYIGIAFFVMASAMFIVWRYSPHPLPVARVVVGAVLFAICLCIYEYVFFEYVYMKFLPLDQCNSSHELYTEIANDVCNAFKIRAGPAKDTAFVDKLSRAVLEAQRPAPAPKPSEAPDPKPSEAPDPDPSPDPQPPKPKPKPPARPSLVGQLPPVVALAQVRESEAPVRTDNSRVCAPPLLQEYHSD